MDFQDGQKVRVLNQGGNICAEGIYRGSGVPKRDLNAKLPTLQHFAVQVADGNISYFPHGFFTLMRS